MWVLICAVSPAQIAAEDTAPHGGMLRYPDVGPTHIVFVYANDLWMVPREGGQAVPLASAPGWRSWETTTGTAICTPFR